MDEKIQGLLKTESRSTMRKERGFTLIELLVVIAVIALLMAILVPTLQRARRQAKAVVCQSRLRQLGLILATYANDNNGSLPTFWGLEPRRYRKEWWGTRLVRENHCSNDLLFCPMATRLGTSTYSYGVIYGGKFLAWSRIWPRQAPIGRDDSSYGNNYWIVRLDASDRDWGDGGDHVRWKTTFVKGADNVPVLLDCAFMEDIGVDTPPECDWEGMGTDWLSPGFCINRHNGYINGLFLDFSARKVGLKELWTLKWHREFDTANRWTIAGGIQPGDWPEWMRRFKDY